MALVQPLSPQKVHILVPEGCTAIAAVGFADLLRKAAGLAAQVEGPGKVRSVEVVLVSPTANRVVRAAGGLRVYCDEQMQNVRRSDLILVPPLDESPLDTLEMNPGAAAWIRKLYAQGASAASACTGTFLLAEAGVLAGRAATTHWAHLDALGARYPRIRVERRAVLVDQGRTCTTGGATSFLNLILFVIDGLYGPRVARMASRMFLIETGKAPQSAYALWGADSDHGDESIQRAQQRMERELSAAPSVGDLARTSAMSRRTFIRRFKQATGKSPREYTLQLRVEAAKRVLEESVRSVTEVAAAVGYGDSVAFRKLFLRLTGLTPRDYRRRFGPMRAPALVTTRRGTKSSAA